MGGFWPGLRIEFEQLARCMPGWTSQELVRVPEYFGHGASSRTETSRLRPLCERLGRGMEDRIPWARMVGMHSRVKVSSFHRS